MGNSLQDQLLKAGLVTEEQARRAREGRRGARGRRAGPKGDRARARGEKPPARARAAEPAPPPGAPADAEAERVKALNVRIRRLIDAHRVNDDAAEFVFHFTRGDRVKHVYVTEAQRRDLARGVLAIAGFRARHHLVPAHVADEIHALRPEIFVFRADAAGDAVDDGVPDDLVW